VIDTSASNIHAFLSPNTCIPLTQLNRLTWEKRSHSPNLKSNVEGSILSKTNSILTGKQGVRCSTFYQTCFSFYRYICFLNTAELEYSEQSENSSTRKSLMGRQHCLQKLTQFSHGDNVLHATASNIVAFLSRDKCVLIFFLLS
jgi:hypothetical protein